MSFYQIETLVGDFVKISSGYIAFLDKPSRHPYKQRSAKSIQICYGTLYRKDLNIMSCTQ